MTVNDLTILTEYEAGHAITAIEWVARSGKPIVVIGERILAECETERLATELNYCIRIVGEPRILGFIVRRDRDFWQYGFFRHRWAMDALLYLQEKAPRIQGVHAHWIRGLLFGYDPDAIQRFISSASPERGSKLNRTPYSPSCRHHRVEMYDPLASSVPIRSKLSVSKEDIKGKLPQKQAKPKRAK